MEFDFQRFMGGITLSAKRHRKQSGAFLLTIITLCSPSIAGMLLGDEMRAIGKLLVTWKKMNCLTTKKTQVNIKQL
jgi:hypothetical protein